MVTDITSNYTKFKPQEYSEDQRHKYFKFLFYSPHQTVLWITSLNMFLKIKYLVLVQIISDMNVKISKSKR